MQAPDYTTFYAASTGAGAALLGLLFVSVSLAPENTLLPGAPWERRTAATSAFTALVNAFFISFGALLPMENPGGIVVVMSLLAESATLRLAVELLREHDRAALRRAVLVLIAVGIYGFECWNGIALLRHAGDAGAQDAVAWLVLGSYGLGLARAWELLGGQRHGLIGRLAHGQATGSSAAGTATDGAATDDGGA